MDALVHVRYHGAGHYRARCLECPKRVGRSTRQDSPAAAMDWGRRHLHLYHGRNDT